MATLVEYSNVPESFALHWDLSVCTTDGQFIFWDNFLDKMAAEYFSPRPIQQDNIFKTIEVN